MNKEQLTDTQQTLQYDTLKIHNYNTSTEGYYTLSSSFRITYEYCSGLDKDDIINIVSMDSQHSSIASNPSSKFINTYFKGHLHHHDFYEFLLVLDGTLINKIEDNEYTYTAGTCCLINKNIRHTEKFIGYAKVLFLALTDDFFKELMSIYKKDAYDSELTFMNETVMTFVANDMKSKKVSSSYLDFFPTIWNKSSSTQLYNLSNSLIHVCVDPHFGSAYITKGLICSIIEFLSDKSKYYISKVDLNFKEDYLLFKRIQHYLTDVKGIATREDLETYFNYSGSYINSIVKKYSNMCLYNFRMQICMRHAATLLKETNLSISEIMLELKFTNTTQFYKIFKQEYGFTPKQYRIQCTSGNPFE